MIAVGSRIRWNGGKPGAPGLLGHEGTVVSLSSPKDRVYRWAWIEYDDGTEKDAYVCHLEEIADDASN